jgi:hypothetical protein
MGATAKCCMLGATARCCMLGATDRCCMSGATARCCMSGATARCCMLTAWRPRVARASAFKTSKKQKALPKRDLMLALAGTLLVGVKKTKI